MSILSLLLSIVLIGCSVQTTIPEISNVDKKPIEDKSTVNSVQLGFDGFDSNLISYIEKSEDFKEENFVVSPVSIKLALGLAIEGSNGETKTELLDALGVENETTLRELAEEMNDISKVVDIRVEEDKKYAIEVNESKFLVSNSIWKNKDKDGKLKEEYKKSVLENYYAKAEEINESCLVESVNNWVKEKTNGLIPNVVNESAKESNTILVNTIYLNDSWSDGLFDEYNTKTKKFSTISNEKVDKDFMCTQDKFSYYEDKDTKLLLTTTNTGFGVLYVLGDNSNIIEKMNKMTRNEVIVEVPKMDIESTFKNKYMVNFMQSLGVNKAFDGDLADFGNMLDLSEDVNVYIDDIVHKTKLTTDEKGIEAAAVTAILMMEATAMIPEDKVKPKEFIANEPFSFYVFNMNDYYENRTFDNTKLLFYGRYVK